MEKKLERDEANKMLAGVAAGLAEYLNVEVVWIRILFVCLTVFGFAGIWIYLILWIVVPPKATYTTFETGGGYQGTTAADASSRPYISAPPSNSTRRTVGLVLLLAGIFFLVNEFVDLPDWISFAKLWPLVLIAIGLVILFGRNKRRLPEPPPAKEEPPVTPSASRDESTGGETII